MVDMRNVYNILAEKSVGRRPLLRVRPRWKVKIKMDVSERGL
jgi:hypothetical protein